MKEDFVGKQFITSKSGDCVVTKYVGCNEVYVKLLILLDILLFWLRFFSSSQLFECLETRKTSNNSPQNFHTFP